MKDKVKNFIKQNLDLIDEEDWERFYKKVGDESGWEDDIFDKEESIGELTTFLLDCGANPLLHVKRVPECYLYGTSFETVEIPENITEIGPMAFQNMSQLKTIVFHKYIDNLGYRCIAYCDNLKDVTIESNECLFYNNIFDYSPNIKHVTFGGTVLDWREHNVTLYDCTVDCSDGTVKYDKNGNFI